MVLKIGHHLSPEIGHGKKSLKFTNVLEIGHYIVPQKGHHNITHLGQRIKTLYYIYVTGIHICPYIEMNCFSSGP